MTKKSAFDVLCGGVAITQPQKEQSVPANFLSDMTEAIASGRGCAEQLWHMQTSRDPCARLISGRLPLLKAKAERCHGAAHALHAGFFAGVESIILDERFRTALPKGTGQIGVTAAALAQRELTLSLLALPQEAKMDLFVNHERFRLDGRWWRVRYAGAVAVARAALACLNRGLRVELPEVGDDIYRKIDLTVTTRGQRTLLCLQIKADVSLRESRVEIIGPVNDVRDDYLIRAVRRGVRNFQDSRGETCTPVILTVGLAGCPIGEVENCPSVAAAADELARLLADDAETPRLAAV